jgi:hypothetical protein
VIGSGVGPGGGVGSGTGTTIMSAGVSGWEMVKDTRHADQPSDATARPITWSIKAANKAAKNGVRITLMASFPT